MKKQNNKIKSFSNCFDLLPVNYQSLDQKGYFRTVNTFWLKTMGYSKKEIEAMNFSSILTDSGKKIFKQKFHDFLKRGNVIEREFDLVKKNGAVITVKFNGTIERDSKGDFVATHFVFEDVTQQILDEKKIMESETRFRTFFDSAPDAMYLIDLKGTIVDGNKKAEALVGYEKNEVIGQSLFKLKILSDVDLPLAIKNLKKNAKSLSTGPDRMTLINKDGQEIPVEITTKPLKLDGKTFILGIARDISHILEYENALVTSESKYRALFENMPTAFAFHKIVLDKKGAPIDYVFLEVNKSFEVQTGLKASKILNKPVSKVLPEIKTSSNLIQQYGNVALSGKSKQFDFFSKPLGKYYHVNAFSPKEGFFVTVFNDFTEYMENEKRLSALISGIPDPMNIVDADLNVLWANDKMKQVPKSVRNLNSPEGKKCYKEYQDDDSQCKACPLRQPINIGETYKHISTCAFNGRVAEVTHTGMLFEEKPAVLEIFRDITEQTKSEKALADAHRKLLEFRLGIEKSDNVVLVTDKDGTIQFANSAVKKVYGWKPSEIIGNNPKIWKTKRYDNKFYKHFWKTILSGKSINVEFTNHTKSGKEVIMQTAINPILDSNKKPISFLSIQTDVTEQRRIENELMESKKRYEALFQSSADAFMTLVPPNWNFSAGNDSALKIFGCKNELEFTSQTPQDFSPEFQPNGQPSKTEAKKMIEKAMKEGANTFEWTHKRLNGEDFPATVLLSRVTVNGQSFLQATVRDITKQKEAENALRASEARYKLLMDGLPYCLKLFDATSTIIDVNKYGREEHSLEGWTDEQIAKWDYIKSVVPSCRKAIADGLNLALQGKLNSLVIKHSHDHAQGGFCFSTMIPVFVEKKVKYVIFASNDITGLKKTEAELKERVEQMEFIGRTNLKRHKEFMRYKAENSKLKAEIKKLKNNPNKL